MRIGVIKQRSGVRVGIIDPERRQIQPFAMSEQDAARGVLGYIQATDAQRQEWQNQLETAVPYQDTDLISPFPQPRRSILCVGRNYHAHAKELAQSVFKDNNRDTTAWPIVFTKVPECVIGPLDPVQLPGPAVSDQIDYEAELAVIIGRGGKNIDRADAMQHVFGYTIVNDVTARDVQMRHGQWDLGKSFDTFCPMGPWVVSADELDGSNTRVRCWVNGEVRQDGHTSALIFGLAELIETCSRGITLYPGDIIATGTPVGVGMGMTPPRYLQAGDVVRVEIDGLGHIENRFVAP